MLATTVGLSCLAATTLADTALSVRKRFVAMPQLLERGKACAVSKPLSAVLSLVLAQHKLPDKNNLPGIGPPLDLAGCCTASATLELSKGYPRFQTRSKSAKDLDLV